MSGVDDDRPSRPTPSSGDGSPSSSGSRSPSGTSSSGSRPPGASSTSGRPPGARPTGSKPSGSRPSGNKSSGSRPSGNKPSGSRPSGSKPSGTRPPGSRPRPAGQRPPGSRPSAASKGPKHRGLLIGAVVGVVGTIAVLIVTLAAGGAEDSSATVAPGATAPVTSSTTLPPVITEKATIPDGDYGRFCEVLAGPIGGLGGGTLTPQSFAEVIGEVDFEALVPATPEGLRTDIELLRDSKAQLVALMSQVTSMSELSMADFPAGVPNAVIVLASAYGEKCG